MGGRDHSCETCGRGGMNDAELCRCGHVMTAAGRAELLALLDADAEPFNLLQIAEAVPALLARLDSAERLLGEAANAVAMAKLAADAELYGYGADVAISDLASTIRTFLTAKE